MIDYIDHYANGIFSMAQGISGRAGYFFAGYGYFPYPNVTGMVYKDPDIRKFNFEENVVSEP